MDLDTFKKEKLKLSKALEASSRKMLVDEFKAFFDAAPEVESVRWTQYTPYFNDGDVCKFHRHKFLFAGKLADSTKKGHKPEDEGDDEVEAGGFSEKDFYSEYSFKDRSTVAAAAKRLDKAFDDTDDVFQAAFGDGVQVTATRNGFTVEDYDHE